MLNSIFELLQEVKVQSIHLSKIEKDLFPSTFREDRFAGQLSSLDGTMDDLRGHVRNREN